MATPRQAPASNSGRSDTEEGGADTHPPGLHARPHSLLIIDRRHASARAPVASETLPLATTTENPRLEKAA